MKNASLNRLLIVMFVLLSVQAMTIAQLKIPRVSQTASITQTIGVTEVTIKYHRPGVKGRIIWGGLVPYDSVWRTGANEATTISFTDTVSIDGHKLPAGTYGLATIPSRSQWTIIFHNKSDLEGAFGYKQGFDALRITVTPQPADHVEWMRFTFEDLKENSAQVVLQWEKLKVAFIIETPTHELVMRSAKKTVGYQQSMQAANYLLGKKTELDQAMKWIDLSTAVEENYWNLRVKAQLLEATGKKKDAISLMERSIAMGEKMQEPPFDFKQMKDKLAEWKK